MSSGGGGSATMTNPCPLCGGAELRICRGDYRFDPPPNIPGGPLIVKDATWEECPSCGEVLLPPELSNELENLRYDRLGLLRPDAIKVVRENTGLSQTEMAAFVGVGDKTYTRWESGRSLQNKSSDNLIRLAADFPEVFAQLEAQRDPLRQEQVADYLDSLADRKGESELAMAAHGAELDLALIKELRDRLRVLAEKRKQKP